jgi:hypothetical protein
MHKLMHGGSNGGLQSKVRAIHCLVPSVSMKANQLVVFNRSQQLLNVPSPNAPCAKPTLSTLMKTEQLDCVPFEIHVVNNDKKLIGIKWL